MPILPCLGSGLVFVRFVSDLQFESLRNGLATLLRSEESCGSDSFQRLMIEGKSFS